MFEATDDPLGEAHRLLVELDNLPDGCRLQLAPFFKHSDDKPETAAVFDVGMLAAELAIALEQARTLQGIARLGRAIWRSDEMG